MNLPPEFISTITNTFGDDGERFLADLPVLIDEASARWGLTDIQAVPNLSYNLVCFALSGAQRSRSGEFDATRPSSAFHSAQGEVVFKIGVPRDELTSEMAALHLFNGDGACRLIDCDEEKGFLLLERLLPGKMLAELADDDEATRIAAEVMKMLWKNQPAQGGVSKMPRSGTAAGQGGLSSKFIQLSDWFDELKKIREMFNGGTGPFDETLVDRVEQETSELFAENHMPVLMHGDLHHYNILSSERGWLVIDPKGVIGPAGYEVGPLMMNPWGSFSDGIESRRKVKRRVDILHEHLGFERERIVRWSLAHGVLSAWWDYPNLDWQYSLRFADLMAGI